MTLIMYNQKLLCTLVVPDKSSTYKEVVLLMTFSGKECLYTQIVKCMYLAVKLFDGQSPIISIKRSLELGGGGREGVERRKKWRAKRAERESGEVPFPPLPSPPPDCFIALFFSPFHPFFAFLPRYGHGAWFQANKEVFRERGNRWEHLINQGRWGGGGGGEGGEGR